MFYPEVPQIAQILNPRDGGPFSWFCLGARRCAISGRSSESALLDASARPASGVASIITFAGQFGCICVAPVEWFFVEAADEECSPLSLNDTPITFRPAGVADASALVALALRCSIDTFAQYHSPENFQKYLDSTHRIDVFEQELADSSAAIWVAAAAAGELIAYARLRWVSVPDCIGDPRAIEIEKFYVDRPFHGRGVASEMMRRCIDIAFAKGHRTIFLGVWEHNHRAIAFYTRKWGYQRCGEHTFMVGDDSTIDWWLRREVADGCV